MNKYKAHVNDIPTVLKKAETFRVLFPNYKDLKFIYIFTLSKYTVSGQRSVSFSH